MWYEDGKSGRWETKLYISMPAVDPEEFEVTVRVSVLFRQLNQRGKQCSILHLDLTRTFIKGTWKCGLIYSSAKSAPIHDTPFEAVLAIPDRTRLNCQWRLPQSETIRRTCLPLKMRIERQPPTYDCRLVSCISPLTEPAGPPSCPCYHFFANDPT